MMEDVGKVFADVGLASVGLVALAAEQMGKAGPVARKGRLCHPFRGRISVLSFF